MIKISRIRMENGRTQTPDSCCVIESAAPSITWAVQTDGKGTRQKAYQIQVWDTQDTLFWDSGWQNDERQQSRYQGKPFEAGEVYTLSLQAEDDLGNVSEPETIRFCYGDLCPWPAKWIGEEEPNKNAVLYFEKKFQVKEKLRSACLFSSGLGYQKVFLNGKAAESRHLDPAFSSYHKRSYYVVFPEFEKGLTEGENTLEIRVATGMRTPFNACIGRKIPAYTGPTQLSAALKLVYEDGTVEWICTDESWSCGYGPVVSGNIYDGEVYDARRTRQECAMRLLPSPGGRMSPQTLESVRSGEVYPAISVSMVKDGVWSVDFGQNIAGVCRIRIPGNRKAGQVITLSHMEFLDEDGTLYLALLRSARAIDQYVASGDERDLSYWEPEFTYHGFRYAEVRGYEGVLTKEDIYAVSRYTAIGTESYFRCGNPWINTIHHNAVQTEKSNLHSILTDCPQRNERMGWLNDATVRFEETPYNFDIGRIFPKVVRDIMDVQDEAGAITDTVPFCYGGRPADPVCSSFLIAARMAWLHTGNTRILEEGYEAFKAWDDYLESRSEKSIVQYSYWGDWAAPEYSCVGSENPVSAVTPGILMSTGYHYYNNRLLAEFARILDRESDRQMFLDRAERIRKAFLEKWYDEGSGKVDAGSQASQAFALWLGILPEEGRQKAADLLHQDLMQKDYQFTTGNLCTVYMLDMLTEYGYVEDVWKLLLKETYPSFGFTIQQEATTIWERFELKKNPGMNSYNHPMYGSVDRWFYAYLAGIRPIEAGWSKAEIRPYMPESLMSAQATVETILGDVTVRWVKRYGSGHLYVTIPFGMEAKVVLNGEEKWVRSGFHHFSWDLGQKEEKYTGCQPDIG